MNLTDSDALKSLIKSRGLKLKFVADHLGLTSYGFALKLNNKQEFKTSEVAALCELLAVAKKGIYDGLAVVEQAPSSEIAKEYTAIAKMIINGNFDREDIENG